MSQFTPEELEQLRAQTATGKLGRYYVAYRDPRTNDLRLLYSAQERQDALHACPAPNILYGGQAGGGKSHAFRWHGIINCLQHQGLKVLLLRRQYKDLEQSHLLKIPEELPIHGEDRIATWNEAKHILRFEHPGVADSVMVFGHCKDEKALGNYLSSEWDIILVDEGSLFTPRMLRMLRTRLRTKNRRIRPQFLVGTNPGGEGHLYLKQRFIDKRVPEGESRNYNPALWAFIPSSLEDNAYLDAEEYDQQFSELTEAEYKAYRLGDWESFAGQYFAEWSRKIHLLPASAFELEEWHEVMGGGDWGYWPGVGVILWGAFDQYGRCVIYQELTFQQSSPLEVAAMLWARCRTPAERRMIVYMDPATKIPQSANGVSILEEINLELGRLAAAEGSDDCPQLIAANNDRMNGWQRVHSYLNPKRPQPDGTDPGPWLRILAPEDGVEDRGCPYLAETLPVQVHDDKMNGDLKKGATDHACDGLRYLLIAREPLATIPQALLPGKSHTQIVHERNRRMMHRFLKRQDQELEEQARALDDAELPPGVQDPELLDPEDQALDTLASLWT